MGARQRENELAEMTYNAAATRTKEGRKGEEQRLSLGWERRKVGGWEGWKKGLVA